MVIFVENDVFMQRWWFANFSMEDKMGWLWIAKSSPFGLPQNKDPQIGSVFSALFFRLQSILIWSPGPGPSKTLVFFSFLVHNPKKPCPLSSHFRRTKIFRSGVWLTRPGGDLSRYQGACGTSIRPGVGSGRIPASNRGRAAGVDWLVRIGIILGGLKFEDTWLQKMLFCLNCVELSEYVPEKLEPWKMLTVETSGSCLFFVCAVSVADHAYINTLSRILKSLWIQHLHKGLSGGVTATVSQGYDWKSRTSTQTCTIELMWVKQ